MVNRPPHHRPTPVFIDAKGFIYIGEFKTGIKLDTASSELEFFDKDRIRSAERGTPLLRVSLDYFVYKLLEIVNKGTQHHGRFKEGAGQQQQDS